MRLRPEQHLRLQGDIRAVREQGRRVDCRAFTVWWLDRPPVAGTKGIRRAAVVASIAAVGHAVLRNRAKRRWVASKSFAEHQNLLPAGCDLLMVSRAAVNARPFPELEKLFIEACGRTGPEVAPGPSFPPLPWLSPPCRTWPASQRLPAGRVLGLIRGYQQLVAPSQGAVSGPGCGCRFTPSWSHYAAEAIGTHGLVAGGGLALRRLAKCTPLHPGGFDPGPSFAKASAGGALPRCVRAAA